MTTLLSSGTVSLLYCGKCGKIKQITGHKNGVDYSTERCRCLPDLPVWVDPLLAPDTIKIGEVTVNGIAPSEQHGSLREAAAMLALPHDPDAFEQLLHPLHDAFLRTAAVMEEIGSDGARYWDILHAAQELLEAMGHLENAAFAWRSYRGEHDHE